MKLDAAKYAEVLDDFLIQMESMPSLEHPGIGDAVGGLCVFLRVAMVRLVFLKPKTENHGNPGDEIVLYDTGDADETRFMDFSEVTATKAGIHPFVYQACGDEAWSEEEQKELQVFLRMLAAFAGRIYVMQTAEWLTYRDRELGIYNATYYRRALDKLIETGSIGRYGAGIFNLKHFSLVNERLGREEATEVIRLFVNNLSEKLTGEECVCRIGSDNFAVLFKKEKLSTVMECLAGMEMEAAGKHGWEKLPIMTSAGYYMIPEDCRASEQIMDCMDQALKIARTVSKEAYAFYDERRVQELERMKLIETLFPVAMKNGEFVVYYQPKVHLTDYHLTGAEALCRWIRNGKVVPPNEFIPVLEQSDAISRLDFYMLECVCRDIRRWLDEGRDVVRISVNFSRCHMRDPKLLERILTVVDRYRIPHRYIEVELTETTTDVAFQDLKRIVAGLRGAGISTAVDDFGIGYSSLNLIRELPWNVLKIDKTFLAAKDGETVPDYMLLKHVIAIAQDIGLECVVEGVETEEHVQVLKENNCYLAQGFYFDRPLPKEQFVEQMPIGKGFR